MDQITSSTIILAIAYVVTSSLLAWMKLEERSRKLGTLLKLGMVFFTICREGIVATVALVPGIIFHNEVVIYLCAFAFAALMFKLPGEINFSKLTIHIPVSCEKDEYISSVKKFFEKEFIGRLLEFFSRVLTYGLMIKFFGILHIGKSMLLFAIFYSLTCPVALVCGGFVFTYMVQKYLNYLCGKVRA